MITTDRNARLDKVIGEIRQTDKKCFAEKIYRDEPILMRAAQMSNFVPAAYGKMHRIAVQNYAKSESEVFYKQAKFMEDFEDDCIYKGDFQRYYPTYRNMSDAQLRGYFTWRTNVRNGRTEKTSLSYAYLYIYELLNGIGFSSVQEVFLHLLQFWTQYEELDEKISVYKTRWLKDFCIYYNLPVTFYHKAEGEDTTDPAAVLLNCENESDEAVFEALAAVSSYKILQSAFFERSKQDIIAVTAGVVRAFMKKTPVADATKTEAAFFGSFCSGKRMLFSGAVFYDRLRRDKYEYRISPTQVYTCEHGIWRYSQFLLYTGRNQPAGAVLRTIDSKLRSRLGYKNALKAGVLPCEAESIIDRCIEDYLMGKRFRAAKEIQFDLRLLSSIRRDSDETQDKLLPQEQQEAVVTVYQQPLNATELSDECFRFILCLLRNEPIDALLRSCGSFVGLLADAANEILYEEFGDAVIVFDGEKPQIAQEYLEDLKGYVGL